MKLTVVTALWKRHRIAKLMLEYTATIAESLGHHGIDVSLLAVGSEGKRSERLARNAGWAYIEYDNMPLSNKYNRVIYEVGDTDADAVVILGSDDFATQEMYFEAVRLLDAGALYVIPNGLHFFCTQSRRAVYLGSHNVGTFRVLSADLLDHLNWHPYINGALSGIDRTMDDKVRHVLNTDRYSSTGPMRLINTNPGHEQGRYLLDVKTGDNLWSFERMAMSITSRFVELDFLQRFDQTGAALLDYEPWHTWRFMRRFRKLDRTPIP